MLQHVGVGVQNYSLNICNQCKIIPLENRLCKLDKQINDRINLSLYIEQSIKEWTS